MQFNKRRLIKAVLVLPLLLSISCDAEGSQTPDGSTSGSTNPDSGRSIEDDAMPPLVGGCDATRSAAFAPFGETASIECDDNSMNVRATGIASLTPLNNDARMMVGITAWILRVPIPYDYSWSIPLNPTWSDTPTWTTAKGPIAFAVNGVPIFHYDARPSESIDPSSYDAGSDTVLRGELDHCGGHAGQGDDYHYHYPPICLLDDHDLSLPIAYGLDGAPIYFGEGGDDYYGSGRYSAIRNPPPGGFEALNDCNAVQLDDGSYAHYTTRTPPYLVGCHHGGNITARQIEPRPMDGREQGNRVPGSYGGQFGEPSTTVVTDFYRDDEGVYHLEHNAFNGSGSSATRYLPSSSATDCWDFEYRADVSSPGTNASHCRPNGP